MAEKSERQAFLAERYQEYEERVKPLAESMRK